MEKNIEKLSNILKKYEGQTTVENYITDDSMGKKTEQKNVTYMYSPKQVDYIKYNKIIYRRELDSQGNIKWECYIYNRSYLIDCPVESSLIEKKFSKLNRLQ
jgi:hypothetical protein